MVRFALMLSLAAAMSAAPRFEIVSVRRIWAEAPHSAFGDLIRFHDRWFCIFREAARHVAKPGTEADGKLRVIVSADGDSWNPAALIEERGIDLRDPHLSITPDGRLMAIAGGSEYPGGRFTGRQPRVMFSRDGLAWSPPARVLERGHWLWRVTWHDGKAYGITKYGAVTADRPRGQSLVTSTDGLHWETVTALDVPGGDETTLRFTKDGRMVALMRCEIAGDNGAAIGVSRPPYRDWTWTKTKDAVGGPNFIVLPDGRMVAGGRYTPRDEPKAPKMALGAMTLTAYEPELVLPSGGDTSYPGFVWFDGLLWTMYYSSHEGNTAIYLAKIRMRR